MENAAIKACVSQRQLMQKRSLSNANDVSNWTTAISAGGSVNTSGAPSTIVLTSSNTGTGNSQSVLFTIAAADSGLFSFNWEYFTRDIGFLPIQPPPFFDPAFYFNGVLMQLTNNVGAASQSGSVSVGVTAGDTIGWQINAIDDRFGSADLTITNFSAPAPDGNGVVPEPMSFLVWGGLLGVAGLTVRRRSS